MDTINCMTLISVFDGNNEKDSYVSYTAPQASVWKSRRICGVHAITANEYVNDYHYENNISRGTYPIDILVNQRTH